MVEFKWIQMSLFLIALLHFTAAAEKLLSVRVGGDVTLPCDNVIDGQQRCEYTTWLFSASGNTAAVELFELGRNKDTNSKSDRLNVTAKCSLVIKKVTVEDVGRYTCRQFISEQQQGPDSVVYLSVITMTEHKDSDKVTLSCSVSTYERCTHTVKWLNEGQDLDKDNQEVKTSQSPCNVSVTFKTSHFIDTSNSNSLKCAVTDGNKEQQFPFRLQPSAEKPGEDTTTTTTTTTDNASTELKGEDTIPTRTTTKPKTTTDNASTELKGEDTTTTTTKPTTTTTTTTTTENASMELKGEDTTTTTTTTTDNASTELKGWWWVFLIVAVVLAALLIIVVKVIRWKRTKGKKTRMNDNVGLTSNPAVTQSAPETSQDTADPEDGVSYASISFTKKTNSKGRVRDKDDDDDDEAVTYVTVKASSSSAGASADPSNLYATVNKPNK
ncbi:uncharacterized protein LOC127351852 [Dicentrarchus labrax]|uniref:uncharacterized protein LOC127351852 n=1 Tax=Dicentrarchus labrax TaxID=13489 RepID=UPI0021F54045|nr:uncharacterized protein LOC127351852 [Dicentrarchus labrax]